MADYIRRSDVGLTDFEIIMCNGDYREALKILLEKIAKAPSVNIQKTAQWIHTNDCDEEWPYRCSNCVMPSKSNNHRYCSNCGSYMYPFFIKQEDLINEKEIL